MASQLFTVSLTPALIARFTSLVPQGKRSEVIAGMVTKYCDENETALREKEMREKWVMHTPYPILKKLLAGKDPWNYSQDQFIKMLSEQEITITVQEAGMLLNKLRDEKCKENGEY